MNRNETEQETRDFDGTPQQENAPIAFLLAAGAGALTGACLMFLFLMPWILRVKEVMP